MCGVIGIVGKGHANQALYDGLTVLQHRGQCAAGIITSDGARVFLRKDNGLVGDVFQARHMVQLEGGMGIGHARYPTAGSDSRAEAQPFFVNAPFGLALSHNGNLINAAELREELFRDDLRQLNTASDSEILLNVLATELQSAIRRGRTKPTASDVFDAVARVQERCRGAYAVVAMVVGYGVLAFRDRFGIRPLVYGHGGEDGEAHMVASESVALDTLGFELVRDVAPGEAILIDMDGHVHSRVVAPAPVSAPCIFEYVYLARPDSMIEGISVYKARLRMGEKLGARILEEWPDHDIDVVIPVPDSGRVAALELAHAIGVKYREGFIKNRYVGRTFIMPGQAERKRSVRHKLNAIGLEFGGKNVLLVDDSIVRGTTSSQIIQMARDAGARKVYLASAAPPVRHPNVYGIDMPTPDEFVAAGRSTAEVCRAIGADRLFYQRLEDLVDAVREGNPSVTSFDTSCFDGRYVTGDVTEEYLDDVGRRRSDHAKARTVPSVLDLAEVS